MKEEICLAALCAVEKPLPVCLKHSMEGRPWCHQSTDTPSLTPFRKATWWLYMESILVSWKYMMFFSRERKADLFLLWTRNNLLMQVTEKALSAFFLLLTAMQKEFGWKRMGWGFSPSCVEYRISTKSQPVPPAWTQGCPQVSVRTSSGNRGSVQISLRQVSLRNLWYRWWWWVRRNKDLQLEKLFFLCKPSKYGMKITAVQQTSICAVQLLSWRLLSEQSCAFSGDRQFFRARMAAASKCMYHCGWINKYPLKKPGSEE